MSVFALTEFHGGSSVSSSQPTICVPKPNSLSLTQNSAEAALLKQYSAHFPNLAGPKINQSFVSHYGAIGDAISSDPPFLRDRLQRQAVAAIPPFQGLSLDCDRPFFMERRGGVEAIVCDTTENTVRQG